MSKRRLAYSHKQQIEILIGITMICIGIVTLATIYSQVWWWQVFVGFIQRIMDRVFLLALFLLVIYVFWAWRTGKFKNAILENRGTLRASTKDKRLLGVCGGIAEYLNIRSDVIRVITLLLFAVSPILTLFVYLILALALPRF